jgi:hypothetical protein
MSDYDSFWDFAKDRQFTITLIALIAVAPWIGMFRREYSTTDLFPFVIFTSPLVAFFCWYVWSLVRMLVDTLEGR